MEDRLIHFQRAAREAEEGTGRLQGVLQLTEALDEIDDLEEEGRECVTRFRHLTDTQKWSFDNVQNSAVGIYMHASAVHIMYVSICEHACSHIDYPVDKAEM